MGIKANRNCGVGMRVWMIQLLVARGQAPTLQVGTLRELQRLYDELIENSVRCGLDGYTASEKSE
ncbi:hypothetical protein Dimus_037787, partial [Dionaea muscipula]